MKKFKTVFKFHLLESMRAKAFAISCIVIFIGVLGLFAYNNFKSDDKDDDKIGYVNLIEDLKLDEKEFHEISGYIKLKEYKDDKKIKSEHDKGDIDGYFIIKEEKESIKIEYYYTGMPDTTGTILFQSYVKQLNINNVVVKEKLDPKIVTSLLSEPVTEYKPIQDTSKKFGVVYIFVMALYGFIIMFGQLLANSIVSEKSTRVMEMMIPRVKPIIMMYAKIFAVLITGLLQMSMIVLAFFAAALLGWADVNEIEIFGIVIDLSVITPSIIIMFFVYFALGFVLYALVFAALGSVVTRTEELQGLLTPLMLIIIGAFFIGMRAIFEPTETYVIVASYIPFATPIVTFTRLILGEAGLAEILVTGVILLVTIIIMGYFTSKIYKKGVLKYSNKVTLKDIFKMIKK